MTGGFTVITPSTIVSAIVALARIDKPVPALWGGAEDVALTPRVETATEHANLLGASEGRGAQTRPVGHHAVHAVLLELGAPPRLLLAPPPPRLRMASLVASSR